MIENQYKKNYAVIKEYFSPSRLLSYCKQDISENM